MSSPLLEMFVLPQIPSNALGFHHTSAVSLLPCTHPCTWPVTYDLCTWSPLRQSPANTAAAKSSTEAVDLCLRAALAPEPRLGAALLLRFVYPAK